MLVPAAVISLQINTVAFYQQRNLFFLIQSHSISGIPVSIV